MFAIVSLSLFWPATDSEEEVSRLVARHQRYWDSIHTLDVEIENKVSTDGGRTWNLASKMTWRKDGPKHRFSKTLFCFSDPDSRDLVFKTFWQEYYCDANESREVLSWNPLPPREPLTPGNGYGRVWASIGEAPPWIANHGVPYWLFFTADSRYTLMELNQITSSRRFLGKVNIDGVELWAIELTNPEDNLVTTVYLDPDNDYAITRREIRVPASESVPRALTGVHRVLERKEVKPGIRFPIRAEFIHSEKAVTVVRVLSVRVNEALPENAFEIVFPSGAKVINWKTGEIYIWGDGRPALTFTDDEKFREWERAQMGYSPARTATTFVLINVAFLLLIVLILVVRRRLSRKASAPPTGLR